MNLQPTLTLADIVGKTTDLPTIPAAALAVMRETNRPEGNAVSVARLLRQDQSLTVRVLRLANSAYYGLTRQVSDVAEAVVLLGMRSVRNLCMVAGTYPWLSRPYLGYDLGPKALWSHSLGVAVAAGVVAERSGKVVPEEAFTAGLLHDLGKVALSVWLENKTVAMLRLAELEESTFDAVERRVLGFDHQDVGAYLAEGWNLPESLVACMRCHHRPDEAATHGPLVDTIHVADYLTMSVGLGLGGDGLRYKFSTDALDRLGLNPEDLFSLADLLLVGYEKHEKLTEGLDG